MSTSAPFQPRRIIVGISGGVDSALSAWLLREQGHQVEGLFMYNWAEDEEGYCSAADDHQVAREVCAELDIPLHQANFSKLYRQQVFQQALDAYQAGYTPNPDVLCNRVIKFGSFLNYARELGADGIATGHYADVRREGDHSQLLRAADENKDQTYFLASVATQALQRAYFPLAQLQKPEVRAKAMQIGLPNYARKDSTGICFVGERPMREFLGRYLQAEPGPIINLDAGEKPIGEHVGLLFYTLGQRRGLGVGGQRQGSDAPWYVVAKRSTDNSLLVSQNPQHPLLLSHTLHCDQVNWLGPPPSLPGQYQARIRHRQALQSCSVQLSPAGISIHLDQPQRAATAGQYAVLYDGRRCLGGARIRQADCRGE